VSTYIDDDRKMPRFRVNRQVMVDPDIFAAERSKIFEHCWLYLGHETELRKKNDFKTRTVNGRPLIFFRNSKGEIKVWINSCPHRGALLCRERTGNTRFMTCFYHGWTFSNSGEMVSLPDDAGYGPDYERPSLGRPAKVDSYRGFVFVAFDENVPDLVTYLAGATEYLDLIADQSLVGMEVLRGTHEYSVKANWKLLVENSFDSYHAASAHQRYFEMVIAARGELKSGALGRSTVLDLGNGHAVIAGGPSSAELFGRELTEQGKREREQRMARLREAHGDAYIDRMQGSRNLVIFPNLVVIDLVIGVVIRKIDPVSAEYMDVTAWELVPPEDGPDLMRQRLDNFLTFWGPGGLASPDDVEALEACQRGFAGIKELPWSDISRGMHKPTPASSDEFQMRTWWRRWNELMTGEVLPPEEHAPPDELHFARSLRYSRKASVLPT
jgi:p-cumate 2,3-dioxygenase subunit alpha